MKAEAKIAIGVFSLSAIVFLLSDRARIVRQAKKWLNVRETGQNQGFNDPKFEALIKELSGFKKSEEWCVMFAKLVWLRSIPKNYREAAAKLISKSSQQTWANFNKDKSGLFEVNKTKAYKGSIVIFQRSDPSKGHAAIVTKVKKDYFETIEGNVEENSVQGVFRKKRKYDYANKNLKLLGFINIK